MSKIQGLKENRRVWWLDSLNCKQRRDAMITSFSFGRMALGSDVYTADLIIFPDGQILADWRRKEGHLLGMEDLTALLDKKPDIIIAGTGVNDRMKTAPGLSAALSGMGITLETLATDKAVERFNTMMSSASGKSVSACFHLTC